MPGKLIRVAPSKSTLSKLAEDHSLTEIAKKLNISRNTVAYWIEKYKIKFRKSRRKWTDKEIEILEARFGDLTLEELSVVLNRTKHAISRQAHLLEKAGVEIAKRSANPEINRGIKITRSELLELLQEKGVKGYSDGLGGDSECNYVLGKKI
ncbi:terminase, ATPase subunit, gpP-like protein [Leptospira broomii serovar Hurstbridge str. 5399]|uniref:Terminase, ATPase subunit, gpP-like protein n=2 Tax=Leptospira broomii TaxID=301541 RepID=T0GKY9_9LEPT|nr:terminase, ATPase subunit, gpP-like protein [Leptospira broomii serovar Hurstbridge str. 5399]